MTPTKSQMLEFDQSGMALIEMLAAVTVAGLLGTALVSLSFQILDVNARNVNHMAAVKQVEAASHWLYQDVEMAQNVTLQGNNGFPLNLTWTDWNNVSYQATYSLQNGNLVYAYSVGGAPASPTTIAHHISADPSQTNCVYVNRQLTITLTATVDSSWRRATETRVLQIVPRPG